MTNTWAGPSVRNFALINSRHRRHAVPAYVHFTPCDVQTLNPSEALSFGKLLQTPLISLSSSHIVFCGNHLIVFSRQRCCKGTSLGSASFPQYRAYHPCFIADVYVHLPPQPSMPSPSDIAAELYGLDNSLCLATRKRCAGGTALSSRPCGAPPLRIPTRIMESSCTPGYQEQIHSQ